jgi:hypothetical protein
MYVGTPMGVEGEQWLENEVKIRIRVAVPYQRGYATVPLDIVNPGMDENNFYPSFEYSMEGLETEYQNVEKFKDDLEEIRGSQSLLCVLNI